MSTKIEQWFDDMSLSSQKELISILFARRPQGGDEMFDAMFSRLDSRYHANKTKENLCS